MPNPTTPAARYCGISSNSMFPVATNGRCCSARRTFVTYAGPPTVAIG